MLSHGLVEKAGCVPFVRHLRITSSKLDLFRADACKMSGLTVQSLGIGTDERLLIDAAEAFHRRHRGCLAAAIGRTFPPQLATNFSALAFSSVRLGVDENQSLLRHGGVERPFGLRQIVVQRATSQTERRDRYGTKSRLSTAPYTLSGATFCTLVRAWVRAVRVDWVNPIASSVEGGRNCARSYFSSRL